MNNKYLLITTFVAIALCGCASKAERTIQELKKISEQYIKDLDNASTKEEVIEIRKEYKKRVEFEINKLSDEEKEKYEKSISWEEAKELERLNKEIDNAFERARERFRNRY